MQIMDALADVPESAHPREVKARLHALACEKYGDIYDGVRVRMDNRRKV